MSEIWKSILDYEGLYEVSNYGRVRSVYRYKRILKPMISNSGYERVDLFKNKNRKQFSVHRLVALTFIDNPEGKEIVNHKDENKLNNHMDNLEWVTNKENCEKLSYAVHITQGESLYNVIQSTRAVGVCSRLFQNCVKSLYGFVLFTGWAFQFGSGHKFAQRLCCSNTHILTP